MFDFSIDEIEIHYEAVVRKRARDTKHEAVMIRTAMNANKKGFKKYIKDLDDMWRKIELAQGRALSTPARLFGALDQLGAKPGGKKG